MFVRPSFALRVIAPPRPDPLRTFVTLGHAETVHEVHPRASWRSWSARTLCRRAVHLEGRQAPQLVRPVAFRGATCEGCRRAADEVIVACAVVRWGEAVRSLVGLPPAPARR